MEDIKMKKSTALGALTKILDRRTEIANKQREFENDIAKFQIQKKYESQMKDDDRRNKVVRLGQLGMKFKYNQANGVPNDPQDVYEFQAIATEVGADPAIARSNQAQQYNQRPGLSTQATDYSKPGPNINPAEGLSASQYGVRPQVQPQIPQQTGKSTEGEPEMWVTPPSNKTDKWGNPIDPEPVINEKWKMWKEQQKEDEKSTRLTAMQKRQKIKDTANLFNVHFGYEVKKNDLDEALKAAEKIPAGWAGTAKIAWLKGADPNNPILSEWQKVKMVLTDATLLNTAYTKGAISDKEMALFSQAAANDDMGSIAMIKPVIERMRRKLDAEAESTKSAYEVNYGELPAQLYGSEYIEDDRATNSTIKSGKTSKGLAYTIAKE